MVKGKGVATKGKDEKGSSKDAFDPLLVESRQAGTCVLMLDSVEEDVVIKAAGAIYKFVEKCNDNKKLLLELNCLPRLIKLISSENRTIRRDATLLLGSLSKHPTVAKALKAMEVIPTIIKLLAPEEETAVNEYAALCLVSLAKYYSCRRQICEHKGVELLIRGLSSSDPDLQKNCIETITLILEDYDSKTMIRELNGLVPIVELVKSEYAVIQSLSLTALQLVTEDASCRAVLRDNTNVLVELVNIVGTPTFKDLHVSAVLVLSNLLQDVDTVQLMKDNGSTKRLISITMDSPPPAVEEDKKVKPKDRDKPVSKVGKKGKVAVVLDDESDTAIQVEVIPTTAEVKQNVAMAISRAAKNADSRRMLTDDEVETLLVYLLSHSSIRVQVAATQAVAEMAQNLVSRDVFGKLGGISLLIKLLLLQDADVQVAAIYALSVVTAGDDYNCREIKVHNGIEAVISLVKLDQAVAVECAIKVLINMSNDEQLCHDIADFNVIPALIQALSFQHDDIQIKAAQALGIFVFDTYRRSQFVCHCGVVPLVALLSSSSQSVRCNATSVIAILTADGPTADALCHAGALEILRCMQLDQQSSIVDNALDRLLNCNLSSKYAITGKLSETDFTYDGFYDVGHMTPGKRLMPLSHYCSQPVNTRRPVLYVNTATLAYDAAASCESSCEVPAEVQTGPSCDDRLLSVVDEARELMMPLQFANAAERVVTLAEFVSGKMGGAVEQGNLANFSWELAISELKLQRQSNVLPLGSVAVGIFYHRALLFKVIGDRIGIPSTLVRGEFTRAWNEVALSMEYEEAPVRFPPKTFVVDLMYHPGRLMRSDSPEAATYCHP